MSNFSDSSFYIVGLARTGKAAVEFLLSQGAEVCVWDDDPSAFYDLPVDAVVMSPQSVYGSGIYDRLSGVLLSPGIDNEHAAVEYAVRTSVPLISDISLFACAFPKVPHIAVTGTNGKSTVTLLLSHVLKACGVNAFVGGNIGEPMLQSDYVEAVKEDPLFLLELSSYQIERLHPPKGFSKDLLDDTGFACRSAILLNIAPDHLERHKTMKNYAKAKEKLFDYLAEDGQAIIGIDDDYSKVIFDRLKKAKRKPLPISGVSVPKGGIGVKDGKLWDDVAGKAVLKLDEVPLLQGAHNAQNLAAVYAQLLAYDLPVAKIKAAFKSFKPPKHRQEDVGKKGKLRFINDSKATNSSAVAPAMRAFENIYWIAGGLVKEEDFSSLYDELGNVKGAYFYGVDKDVLETAFQSHIPCQTFSGMEAAFSAACLDAKESKENAVILLSPAAASFDQYRDFTHRGEVFKKLVKSYKT